LWEDIKQILIDIIIKLSVCKINMLFILTTLIFEYALYHLSCKRITQNMVLPRNEVYIQLSVGMVVLALLGLAALLKIILTFLTINCTTPEADRKLMI
jgi:hypothetical protein